jgi:hypothetical protein
MDVASILFSLMMRARLRTKGGTAIRACALFSASMMAHPLWIPALQPVKIPEIAFPFEQLDQIKAFRRCLGRLDRVAIHVFLLCERLILRL